MHACKLSGRSRTPGLHFAAIARGHTNVYMCVSEVAGMGGVHVNLTRPSLGEPFGLADFAAFGVREGETTARGGRLFWLFELAEVDMRLALGALQEQK